MDAKDKIELIRTILHNAIYMNLSKSIILKISQKLDKSIVEYHNKTKCKNKE